MLRRRGRFRHIRAGIGKTLNRAGDDILSSVPAIPDLIARGRRLSDPIPPRDATEAISTKAWHVLGGDVGIDGRTVRMFIHVREDHAGHFFYNLRTGEGGAGLHMKADDPTPEGINLSRMEPTPDGNIDAPKGKENASGREYEQGAQGKIRLADDGRSTITLMRTANASTFIHETGHDWLERMMRDAADPDAPAAMRTDAASVPA